MAMSAADQRLLQETYAGTELAFSSGDGRVDDILRGIVGLYERTFPGRVAGYYLAGSYADGTAVSTSDIDFHPMFRDGFRSPDERALARQVGWLCNLMTPLDLGIVPRDAEAPAGYKGVFKLKCRRVFGEELGHRWSLPPIESYTLRAMRNDDLRRSRDSEVLRFPIDYPDPDDEFFGYIDGEVFSLDGYRGRGTKEFVRYLYGLLIPLVSRATGDYAASKHAAFGLYQKHINDEWAPYLNEVWQTCRQRWEYRLPESPAERRRLRSLCERTLGFENHYLSVTGAYWLEQLERWKNAEQGNIGLIIGYLGTVIFPDGKAAAALQGLRHPDEKIMRLAADTLQSLRSPR